MSGKGGISTNTIFEQISIDDIWGKDDALFLLYNKKNDVILETVLTETAGAGIDSLYFGHTLLAYAAMDGRAETARILLKHGANPLIKNDPDKAVALHYAVKNNNWDVMEVLASDSRFLNTAAEKDAFGNIPEDYALYNVASMLAYAKIFTSKYSFEEYKSIRQGNKNGHR